MWSKFDWKLVGILDFVFQNVVFNIDFFFFFFFFLPFYCSKQINVYSCCHKILSFIKELNAVWEPHMTVKCVKGNTEDCVALKTVKGLIIIASDI